jgi:choline-sulfatase
MASQRGECTIAESTAAIRLIDMLIRWAWRGFFSILIFTAFALDASAADKPNIVLITLDATRADRMGFLGSRKGLTPDMDRIARQSIVFEQAYSQAPLTVASSATVLTGTYPQTNRASELGVLLPETVPYLPDILHAHGYRTAAFVGSILLDPQNGPFQGFDRGFDVYDAGFQQPQRGESRYQTIERRGDEVAGRATRWLAAKSTQPTFVWVHLNDSHGIVGSSYDRTIAATDAAVGKLMEGLKAKGLYDDALVIVVSAHGESLGAHGEEMSGMLLYDETIHVPLMLKLPKNQKMPPGRVTNRARLLDIAPTVIELAGIPVPSEMQGESLRRIAQANSQADQPAYARTDLPQQGFGCSLIESWRAGKYLYVRAPNPELYDLSADPNASRNLAQTSKATLQVLAAQLAAFDRHFDGDPRKPAASRLTSSEMQKLASLGYIGLQHSGASSIQAIKGIDPKDALNLANQTLAALLALDDGKPEQAIPLFHSALAFRDKLYLAQYGMAVALSQEQRYADAIGYLHSAIKLQPESPWAHYEMGIALLKTGDFQTSSVHLEIALRLLPEFSSLHAALADVYEQLGKSQESTRERAKVSH